MLRIITLATFICALGMSAAMAQTSAVSLPKVTGPVAVIPGSNEPYRAVNEHVIIYPGIPALPPLKAHGYVEEEYFVSGTVDGKPYTTAILVRKPKDPAKFSGLVAVETIHTEGMIALWGPETRDVWLNGGHAGVAIASQRFAVEEHYKKSNPARYASLNIPDVMPPPAPGANPMAAMMGSGPQDKFSQDIMSQVGLLLKSNLKNGPFAGLTVKKLMMGGGSQTGGTTLRYIAESHNQARMPDGKPIYDGYYAMESIPAKPLPIIDAIVFNPITECDLMNALAAKRQMAMRPDSDAPNDRYRHYEVVGASHVPTRGLTDIGEGYPGMIGTVQPNEHMSQFPHQEVDRGTMTLFVDWLMKDVVPPKARPIEVANGEIVRDEFGNAKGGVRSPYVDVPTAHYIAAAPNIQGAIPRSAIGLQEPIAPEKLMSMYKSRAEYLKRFDAGIDRMVQEHWLLAKDGEKLKAEESKGAPMF